MNNSIFSRMKRASRKGTVSLILGAALLALLLVVNLLVGLLPAKVTVFDASGIGLTEISDETAKFVSRMEENVTIYWLCADGIVDDQFELMLTRYKEAGKHITVKVIDTTENPKFAEKYTDVTLSDYSMIIESARRHTTVDTADMYLYTNQFITENLYSGTEVPMTADQFQQIYESMLQYYGVDITQYSTSLYFRGEALVTAALDYVTRAYIPHAYLLTGHGAEAPSETLAELMSSMGLAVEKLDLGLAQSVPGDANCLILFSPESDLTAHETALLKEYLNQGGSFMVNTAPDRIETQSNLQSVCATFGLSALPGKVEEGDVRYIANNTVTTLVPTVSTEHTATAYVSQNGYKAQMPYAHAIGTAETLPAGVVVSPLMTTSETATRVPVSGGAALGTAGKLNVAVAATKTVTLADGRTDTAYLSWFGSAEAITDDAAEDTSGGNYYYYAAVLSYMSEPFVSSYENLSAVNMSGGYLSGLTVEGALGLGAVVVLILPVSLLTAGIVIWVRRKKR